MSAIMGRLRLNHQVLVRQAIYPILLSSLLASVLLLGRVYRSRTLLE